MPLRHKTGLRAFNGEEGVSVLCPCVPLSGFWKSLSTFHRFFWHCLGRTRKMSQRQGCSNFMIDAQDVIQVLNTRTKAPRKSQTTCCFRWNRALARQTHVSFKQVLVLPSTLGCTPVSMSFTKELYASPFVLLDFVAQIVQMSSCGNQPSWLCPCCLKG